MLHRYSVNFHRDKRRELKTNSLPAVRKGRTGRTTKGLDQLGSTKGLKTATSIRAQTKNRERQMCRVLLWFSLFVQQNNTIPHLGSAAAAGPIFARRTPGKQQDHRWLQSSWLHTQFLTTPTFDWSWGSRSERVGTKNTGQILSATFETSTVRANSPGVTRV